MNVVYQYPEYQDIFQLTKINDPIAIIDHLNGFEKNLYNPILDYLNQNFNSITVSTNYVFNDLIKSLHSNLNFVFDHTSLIAQLSGFTQHKEIEYKNFLCSFNGSPHVSRKLLASILNRFGWFNQMYCSKNFSYSTDILDGHISDYVGDSNNFYRKFFISDCSEDFFQTVNSFRYSEYTTPASNIYNLESKLTESFLHIVSETMATSYYPFVTEKFLYSIVTRGLFLAYAQPGWHAHVEKYYGFQRYTRLFDYRFDTIENPIERLVELMSMIAKFSILSPDDWTDLYELEKDTIEYNYNHYFSGDYLNMLKNYA
jgi:hypothetical protein